MSIRKLLLAIALLISLQGMAQNVGINTDGSAPDNSAMLDVKGNKGLLIPRMTQTERAAIANPATALLVYQTDNMDGFYFNKGTAGAPNWQYLGGSSSGGVQILTGTTGGVLNHTITDLSLRSFVVTFNGTSGAASTLNFTLPSASSYPSGTVLAFSVTAYITANPSWSLTSPSSTYNALNNNNVSLNSGVSVGATNGFRLVANGSSWYRLLP